MAAAQGRGDDAASDRIAREIADRYPHHAIRYMLATQLLAVGARDGSLPARQHDELQRLLADRHPSPFAEQFAKIERRAD